MIKRALCVMICCLLLTLWAAGSVIPSLAKDEKLLLTCFRRYAQTESFGVDTSDYPLFAAQLSAFFNHETDDPTVSSHPFHDYEVIHLHDVRQLMDALMLFARGCLAGAIVTIVLLVYLYRRQRFSFFPGYFSFLLLAGAVILAAVCSFNTVFYYLHALLFSNDLWLLNPATDLLIALMPEGMFIYLARRVLYRVLPLLALLSAAAAVSSKYAQPRQ